MEVLNLEIRVEADDAVAEEEVGRGWVAPGFVVTLAMPRKLLKKER